MPTARIFQLIDFERLSPELADAAKEANAHSEALRLDPVYAVILTLLRAEPDHYSSMIDQARAWFTRNLESIEQIESAHKTTPTLKVLEGLNTQVVDNCQMARQFAVRALKSLNIEYAQCHVAYSFLLPEEEKESLFQRLLSAFLAFYREMEEVETRVATAQTLAEESKNRAKAEAVWFQAILDEEYQLLAAERAAKRLLQRQISAVQRQIAKLLGGRPQSTDRHMLLERENEHTQQDRISLEQKYHELVEKSKRQDVEIERRQKIIENLVKNSDYTTIDDLVVISGVTQQSVSRRILELMENGRLDKEGREGRRHKFFDNREVKIILDKWPKKKLRASAKNASHTHPRR